MNSIVKIGSGRPLTPTVTGDSSGDLNGNGVPVGDGRRFLGATASSDRVTLRLI
jgi:hypothetical protein